MQTETEQNDGYIRVLLTPIAIVSVIMLSVYDLESLTIPIINRTIVFMELSTLWFLTLEERNLAGQLVFSLLCATYLCACIIALCTKDEPSDTYKPEKGAYTVSIIKRLGQVKLQEVGLFVFGSYMVIFFGYTFWVIIGSLIGLFLLVALNAIELVFQFDTPKDTTSNISQVLIYIWVISPCFLVFFALFNLRARNKMIIDI
jgi:hypothetical protein